MSTLTKILIVLLTLSSIFLCGIVVTYVANAEDYKQKNRVLRTSLDTARENERGANDRSKECIAKSQRLETKLNNQIAALNVKIRKVENDLTNTGREKAKLLQELTGFASEVETANQTAALQTRLFENAQNELKEAKTDQEKKRKELSDITTELNEQLAIKAILEADVRRLQEEKVQLQSKLDRFLRQFGKETVPPRPVTPKKTVVRPAPPVARKIGLNGLVTAVDLKNSVAEISIGAAHGVRKDMRFYVIRGDEFICEIRIHHVDTERAVGELRLVQKQPSVGDNVTANL